MMFVVILSLHSCLLAMILGVNCQSLNIGFNGPVMSHSTAKHPACDTNPSKSTIYCIEILQREMVP